MDVTKPAESRLKIATSDFMQLLLRYFFTEKTCVIFATWNILKSRESVSLEIKVSK